MKQAFNQNNNKRTQLNKQREDVLTMRILSSKSSSAIKHLKLEKRNNQSTTQYYKTYYGVIYAQFWSNFHFLLRNDANYANYSFKTDSVTLKKHFKDRFFVSLLVSRPTIRL